MIRRRHSSGDLLTAMLGFGIGTAAGLVVGELIGGLSRERVQRGLKRLRRAPPTDDRHDDPLILERAVLDALRANPSTRAAGLAAKAIGMGAVELVGWVATEEERSQAEKVARKVAGVTAVINRVLVRGDDGQPPGPGDVESARAKQGPR